MVKFAECPEEMEGGSEKLDEGLIGVVSVQCPPPWELYVDGVANQRGSGVGLVLVSPERITIEKSLRLNFSATNNEAEYEALLMGMMMVQKMGGKAVKVFSDSKLVLWTYRTTPRKSTGKTLFAMTYGAEAVIPLENGFPTMRSNAFTSDGNNELLKKNLDLIEERRENAMMQLAYYQHKLKQGYDMNVKLRPLAPGDLVLRKVVGNTKNPAWGKLGPNWEGPYRVISVVGVGVYYLEDLDERAVLHPWNVNNLKRYYY